MTLSVGLGKIIPDPRADVLTRKALGVLSTPGLLVYDDALSIDGTGRMVLKLNGTSLANGDDGLSLNVKDNGGLTVDDDGVSLTVTFGIDSHVDLDSDLHNREWNAYITGTAPNYMESGLAIGAPEFNGLSTSGTELADAMLSVTVEEPYAQARFRHDDSNFTAFRTLAGGESEIYAVGDDPSFHLLTGDGTYGVNEGGVRINNGTTVEGIWAFSGTMNFTGGGTVGSVSQQESTATVSPGTGYDMRPAQDVVVAVPADGVALPSNVLNWSVRISATNQLSLRLGWFNVLAAYGQDWIFLVHRMKA